MPSAPRRNALPRRRPAGTCFVAVLDNRLPGTRSRLPVPCTLGDWTWLRVPCQGASEKPAKPPASLGEIFCHRNLGALKPTHLSGEHDEANSTDLPPKPSPGAESSRCVVSECRMLVVCRPQRGASYLSRLMGSPASRGQGGRSNDCRAWRFESAAWRRPLRCLHGTSTRSVLAEVKQGGRRAQEPRRRAQMAKDSEEGLVCVCGGRGKHPGLAVGVSGGASPGTGRQSSN
jgi:hypothetical protein